jgi:hypothetical protein
VCVCVCVCVCVGVCVCVCILYILCWGHPPPLPPVTCTMHDGALHAYAYVHTTMQAYIAVQTMLDKQNPKHQTYNPEAPTQSDKGASPCPAPTRTAVDAPSSACGALCDALCAALAEALPSSPRPYRSLRTRPEV